MTVWDQHLFEANLIQNLPTSNAIYACENSYCFYCSRDLDVTLDTNDPQKWIYDPLYSFES